jgi:predicted nucleotidyltransferase/biotin operon repressor
MTEGPLSGLTAVVTGASAGIGEETVRVLAREGANVALAARREDRLERIAVEVESAHDVGTLVMPTDVTDEDAVADLVDATGASRSTVWRAVELLAEIGAVRVRETPQRNYVTIEPDRLRKDDPILAIEQSEFHAPVRAFVETVGDVLARSDEVERLVAIIIFGSIARGEGDRQSDLDCFVVVEGDRTAARRLVSGVVSELRDQRFGGDRFEFEQYVESVESAMRAGGKLREIFDEGITIYEAEGLQDVRTKVMASE